MKDGVMNIRHFWTVANWRGKTLIEGVDHGTNLEGLKGYKWFWQRLSISDNKSDLTLIPQG